MKEFISHLGENIYLDKSILVHKYRDFKKTEKGQKMIETYLDRWKNIGFIEGLEGEIRERCAVGMEQLAVYLLTENENNENFDKAFEVIGFPMIRRICCGSVGNQEKLNDLDLFDFLKFISYCKELNTEKLVDDIHSIINWTKIDAEAEACALACEMIINRFNGDDRDFDDIKSEYIDKLKEKINKEYEGTGSDNTNA
jgi:hypothetical protein